MSADLLPRIAGSAWEVAWSAALTDMELSLAQAESLLRASHSTSPGSSPAPWYPPVGLGPLPASLVVRAQALLDRQLDVARRTGEAANFSRRQAIAAQGMRSRPPAVPVYIDADG
ncbi:MAG: hypothetical protein HHJ14_02210 [Cellulomonas sp.]|nr:hypothetical protein [Cellulomonas sp.]